MSLLIAHRGASSEAPENTLISIQCALEIGVDGIEIDVHLTCDGHLVAIHDATVGRTAWGAAGKRISAMTLEEIKTLDAGSWFGPSFSGEKIPTLAEILAIDRGSAGLMVEVKQGDASPAALARAVVKTVQDAPRQVDLCIGSFSVPLLEEIQQLDPKLALVGIVEKRQLLNSFETVNLACMAIWYKLLNPSLVDALQEKEIALWTFTVDDSRTATFLVSLGVAGIITNRPRELYNCVKKRSPLF